MIELKFSNLHQDGPSLNSTAERLLRIVADLSINVDERLLYKETDVPIVELAGQLWQWLKQGEIRTDFSYESMESDTPGLISIKRGSGGWQVGSVHQEYEEVRLWPLEDIDRAVQNFLESVVGAARNQLAVDVHDIIKC